MGIEVLYRNHANEFAAVISRCFGAIQPDPKDAVHAAFTQFAALHELQLVGNPRAFLYQSARNFVLGYRRRLHQRQCGLWLGVSHLNHVL
jgi:DNA-directed RNA polymerase specialized sigma24 family protein